MSARILVIGLDSAEATLLEKWAAEGYLPNLARVADGGAVGKLGNPMETLPGAIWPEIWSGRSSGKTGLFYHPEQIHTGEANLRPIEHDEIDATDNYWSAASRAGLRVCVVDQAHSPLNTDLNGVQVLEWGLHDRTFTERCHPPELMEEIHRRYGLHPLRSCDRYADTREGRQALLEDLLEGSSLKQALVLDLMQREDWDLFTCTLAESHCVGHHFWHCLDATSPRHETDAPEDHRNAIRTLYQRMDETVGKLIDAGGPETTTLIIASHGIGPAHAGYHLLPEVLARLGMNSDRGSGGSGLLRQLQTRIKNAVPYAWHPMLRALSRLGPVKAVQRRAGALRFPLESPLTRAVAVPNNRVGAIRMNLEGREPFGCVEPGAEADALMEELCGELVKLEDPRTGDSIVERVLTANEVFGSDHHADLPDILVLFRTGYGPIEACRSDRVGLIEIPYFTRRTHRSGDHTVESRLWAIGPNVPAGLRLQKTHVLDIAPTVLDLLGVPLPRDLDGRPIAFDGRQLDYCYTGSGSASRRFRA